MASDLFRRCGYCGETDAWQIEQSKSGKAYRARCTACNADYSTDLP